MGIVEVAALAASAANFAATREYHAHLALNQISRQRRQPIVLAARPAVFDRHVLAFDKSGFVQALAKPVYDVPERFGRSKA